MDVSICSIAPETMALIVSHCGKADLPALMGTCRRVNMITVRPAYTDIRATQQNARTFFRTILRTTSTHNYGSFVRKLSIDMRGFSSKLPQLSQVLLALIKMNGLRYLKVMIEPPRIPILLRQGSKLGLFLPSHQSPNHPLPVLNSLDVHGTPDLYKLARGRTIEHIASAHYFSPKTLLKTLDELDYAWPSLTTVDLRLREYTSVEECILALCSRTCKLKTITLSRGHSSSVVSVTTLKPLLF